MSLIEEALRRVHDPLIAPRPAAPPVSPPAATPPTQAAPAHPWPTMPPADISSPSPAPRRVTTSLAVALALCVLSAVLVIGGAFWMGQVVGRPTPAAPEPKPLTPAGPAPTAAPFPKPAPLQEIPRLSIPGVKKASPQEQYVLSGVVEGDGEPYAVINGMIFGVGERVGNATVMEIANGAVKLLQSNGKELILRVPR
ncbi:MAG: hypothetical protein HYZ96_03295 [Candidatus Omnitrophica bacterium]|nr:hypothetical protein [Candidatus Omnitrophota bacterium]